MSPPFLGFVDRFVPAKATADPEVARRTRASVVVCWLGAFWSLVFGAIYAVAGSPVSGAALGVVALGLLLGPLTIRAGWSLTTVANVQTTVTWLATFVIAARTGGFGSPAIIWSVFHPSVMYAACGLRSAAVWAALCGAQLVVIFVADMGGAPFVHELTPLMSDSLRFVALLACLGQFGMVLRPLELVRLSAVAALERSNRERERERILADMHDGVGSQMLGMIVELKAHRLDPARMLHGLERCLDDLRGAVRAPYAVDAPLEVALGELRPRLSSWCQAAGAQLVWSIAAIDPPAVIPPGGVPQAVGLVHEAIANALRHARAHRIEVILRRAPAPAVGLVELLISDDGVGFDPAQPPTGSGIASMRARSARLGGELSLSTSPTGTSVAIRFPA